MVSAQIRYIGTPSQYICTILTSCAIMSRANACYVHRNAAIVMIVLCQGCFYKQVICCMVDILKCFYSCKNADVIIEICIQWEDLGCFLSSSLRDDKSGICREWDCLVCGRLLSKCIYIYIYIQDNPILCKCLTIYIYIHLLNSLPHTRHDFAAYSSAHG